jgi:hypothetical protein
MSRNSDNSGVRTLSADDRLSLLLDHFPAMNAQNVAASAISFRPADIADDCSYVVARWPSRDNLKRTRKFCME